MNCERCNRETQSSVCQHCGFSIGGRDASHLQCAHERQGQRCAALGSISPGTHGDSPFYCWPHYAEIMGWDLTKGAPPPQGFKSLRSAIKPVPRLDFEAMSERNAIQSESP